MPLGMHVRVSRHHFIPILSPCHARLYPSLLLLLRELAFET